MIKLFRTSRHEISTLQAYLHFLLCLDLPHTSQIVSRSLKLENSARCGIKIRRYSLCYFQNDALGPIVAVIFDSTLALHGSQIQAFYMKNNRHTLFKRADDEIYVPKISPGNQGSSRERNTFQVFYSPPTGFYSGGLENFGND